MILISSIQADVKTKNNEIFPKDVLINSIEEYNNKIIKYGVYGNKNIRNEHITCLKDSTHEIIDIYLNKNNFVEIEFRLLDKPIKKEIIQMIEKNNIYIKYVGHGDLDSNNKYLNYYFIAFDLIKKEE